MGALSVEEGDGSSSLDVAHSGYPSCRGPLFLGGPHGGASGHLAVLALAGFARPEATPVVRVLNILVAPTGFVQYYLAGHFLPRLLLPFVITSVPASFIGGVIPVNERVYAGLMGGALVAAAVRFLFLSHRVTAPIPSGDGPTFRTG